MMAFRESVWKSWSRNTMMWQYRPAQYWDEIRDWLDRNRPKMFRWHVGGDVPDADYLEWMISLAEDLGGTQFLMFTKRYELFPRELPKNLTVVLSAWPGVELPEYAGIRACGRYWPVAWVQDGVEERIPETAVFCPHGCDGCGMCWELSEREMDVVLEWKRGYGG
jgi:hypothetical protein